MSAISNSQPCCHCQNHSVYKPKQSSIVFNPIVKTVTSIALYIFGLAAIIFGICLSFTQTPIISLATAASIGMKWTLIAGIITAIAGVFTIALSYKLFNEAKESSVSNDVKKPVIQKTETKTAEIVEDSDEEPIELTNELVIKEATEKYSKDKYKGRTKLYVEVVKEKLEDGILENPKEYMLSWRKENDDRRESVRGFFKALFGEMGLVKITEK